MLCGSCTVKGKKMKDGTARKLLQLYLDQKVENWMNELDGVAVRIGLSRQELFEEVKPLLQGAFEKHLKKI